MRLLRRTLRLFWLNTLAGSYLCPRPVRAWMLRRAGIRVAGRVNGGCFFSGGQVSIGEGSFVNHRCLFDGSAPIVVGERCNIGPEVAFVTSTHEPGDPSRRAGDNVAEPIRVGAGAWIGARVTILPGVKIGEGCVISAAAVVRDDCKPNALYAGVPAVWKKDL